MSKQRLRELLAIATERARAAGSDRPVKEFLTDEERAEKDAIQAGTFTRGQRVWCPTDNGQPGYTGTVESWGDEVHVNHQGHGYRWVTVRDPKGNAHVWPSNRLQ